MTPADRAARLRGYGEAGIDGHRTGKVGQVYTDHRTGAPGRVTVRAGRFGNRESFVPTGGATVDGDLIVVAYDEDTVCGPPHHASDVALTVADQNELHAYDRIDSPHSARGGPVGGTPDHDAPPAGIGENDGAATGPMDRTGRPHVPAEASAASAGYLMLPGEQRRVGTRTEEAGRARLRTHVVAEQQSVTVPVERDTLLVSREPIAPGTMPDATIGEDAVGMVPTRERLELDRETVPAERVRLATRTVVDQRRVSDAVRPEQLEVVADIHPDAVGRVRADIRRDSNADATAPP